MRQLASAREFKLSHDAEAASRILGFRTPGDTIAPGWLLDDACTHSQAMCKQGMRARKPSGKATGKLGGDGGSSSEPYTKGGRGGGRGRGRGRGGKGPADGQAA